MTELQRFDKDGIELAINLITGEVFYPGFRALARVCSLGLAIATHQESVRRAVKNILNEQGVTDNGGFRGVFHAEIQTPGGLQGVTLISSEIGTDVIGRFNKELYHRMAHVGHLVFLHQLVGYKANGESNQESVQIVEFVEPKEVSQQTESSVTTPKRYEDLDKVVRMKDLMGIMNTLRVSRQRKQITFEREQNLLEQAFEATGIDPDDPRYAPTLESTAETEIVSSPFIQSPFTRWLRDCVEVTNNSADVLHTSQVYASYLEYFDEQRLATWGRSAWSKAARKYLKEQFGWAATSPDLKQGNTKIFRGLKLK